MQRLILVLLLAVGLWYITIQVVEPKDDRVLVDPRLKSYVTEWCWEMEKAGIPWEESFRELNSITATAYSVDSRETGAHWRLANKITINERYLDRNPCAVKATVFHELGHAVFGLEHGSCTIMRARTLVEEEKYCDNWDLYLDEYLVQCKKAAQ